MINAALGVLPRLGLGLAAVIGALVIGAALSLDSTPLALAVVGALGMGALAVWHGRPKRLLIALLFFTTALDVSKAVVPPLSQFYSPGLYLSPAQVIAAMLVAWQLARPVFVERSIALPGTLDALVLAFVGLLWVGALRSQQGSLALASAVAYTLCVMGYWAASQSIRTVSDVRLAVLASAVVLLLEMVHVGAQMATGSLLQLPGSKNEFSAAFLTFGGEGLAFRPTGFQGHPNALGHHMVVMLLPAIALLLLGRRGLGARRLAVVLAVAAASATMLLLTLSRGGWVSATVGILLVVLVSARIGVISRRQLAGLAVIAGLGVAAAVVAYPQLLLRLTATDDRSVESRVLLTDQALAIIRANPLAGVGFGGYNRASYEYIGPRYATVSEDFQTQLHKVIVHNGYLLLAVELGVPVAVLFAVIFLCFVRLPWPMHRWRDPGLRSLALGLAAGLLGQMVYFSSDNYYADTRVFMLWLTAGLLRAVVRIGTRADAPAAGPPRAP